MLEGEKITIGITTKDRQDDLDITLKMLHELGYALPILIIDDGSETPLKVDHLPNVGLIRLIRFDESGGLIQRRNDLAKLIETTYYLSLDDDSCFREYYDLGQVVRFLDENQNVAGIGLNIFENGKELYRNVDPNHEIPFFVGCGHILRASAFRELGGYKSFFKYGLEESDFGLRVYSNGLILIGMKDIIVLHRKVPTARRPLRNWEYLCRNTVAMWILNLSLKSAAYNVVRSCVGKLMQSLQFSFKYRSIKYTLTAFRGLIHGLFAAAFHLDMRQPVNDSVAKKWIAMRRGKC